MDLSSTLASAPKFGPDTRDMEWKTARNPSANVAFVTFDNQ
jgi:hypothetical protein